MKTFIILSIISVLYILFCPLKYKRKLDYFALLVGLPIGAIVLIKNVYNYVFQDLLCINNCNPNYWPGWLIWGAIWLAFTTSFGIILSNQAWAERDDSKDDKKFRLFFGRCIYCKEKVSKFATNCPHCLKSL